ncbi:MFS transporter [Indiicoccus explosivorum]|uniref:MFS transporter n=1 Tax=Indiicoccus explosivorum TaxID=1917864 RepID=UPI000B44537C|nr:MFS transporter [Indiicoccus explosivorum]
MTESARRKRATYHLCTFTLSKLISSFGSSVYAFGLSLFILSLTGSAASFAINLICSILPRTVLAPVAGFAADRYSKKMLVILGQAGSMTAVTGLLLYSLTNGLSLQAVYITTVFVSIGSMFASVTFSSSIANLIDPDRIQRATAFNQSAVSLASIGGPVIGGVLFGFVSMEIFLLIQAGAYLTAVLLESTMDFRLYTARQEKIAEEQERMLQSLQKGWAYMRRNRTISVIVTAAVGINFFFSATQVGLAFIVVEELGISSTNYGLIEAMIFAGMLLASVYFSVRKEVEFPLIYSKRGILVMSVLLAGIGIPLVLSFGGTAAIVYYLVLMLCFGAATVCINTPIGVMLQKDVEEAYRGRIFGLLESMAMAMMPLGMLVFGLLFDAVPAEWVVIGSAACLIALTGFLMRPSVIQQVYPEKKVVPRTLEREAGGEEARKKGISAHF